MTSFPAAQLEEMLERGDSFEYTEHPPWVTESSTKIVSSSELAEKGLKHGTHNQLTHGRGRSGGDSDGDGGGSGGGGEAYNKAAKSVESTSNKKYLDHHASRMNSWMKTDEAARAMKKVYPSAGTPEESIGKGEEPIGEMKDFPKMAVSNGRWYSPDGSTNRNHGWVMVRSIREGTSKSIAKHIGNRITDEDVKGMTLEYRDKPADDGTVADAVTSLSSSWNNGGSQSPAMVAMQQHVAKKFGLEGHRGPMEHHLEAAEKWLERGTNKKVMEAVADGIYANTQAHLKDMGIESLVVYRGQHRSSSDKADGYGKATVDSTKTNALSSFSTSISNAEKFSADAETPEYGDLIGGVVPAKDIFSMGTTGLGTLSEAEVVVMHSSSRKMKARTFKHDKKYDPTIGEYGDDVITWAFEHSSSFWSDE